MQRALSFVWTAIVVLYTVLIVLPATWLFFLMLVASLFALNDPIALLFFFLPSVVGLIVGTLTYDRRPSFASLLVVGSFLYLSGMGFAVIFIGLFWVWFAEIVFGMGIAKFWRLRAWPWLRAFRRRRLPELPAS